MPRRTTTHKEETFLHKWLCSRSFPFCPVNEENFHKCCTLAMRYPAMESAMSVQGIPSSRHSQVVSRAPFTQYTYLHTVLVSVHHKRVLKETPLIGLVLVSTSPLYLHAERRKTFCKGDFFFLCTLFNTASSTALIFHCVGECWDRTQDYCDIGIDRQTLYNHSARSHPLSLG